MSGQATPGFMAACTAWLDDSTAWYTSRCSGVNRPFTGNVQVMSAE